ncbi:hypothetical protein U0070_012950 [Myodes glareolus]|uniref:Uncharacterized protein n=1 Tax=Myodes glareolus TaxID=447135 RepID=A0AAW0JFU7_MYOGA
MPRYEWKGGDEFAETQKAVFQPNNSDAAQKLFPYSPALLSSAPKGQHPAASQQSGKVPARRDCCPLLPVQEVQIFLLGLDNAGKTTLLKPRGRIEFTHPHCTDADISSLTGKGKQDGVNWAICKNRWTKFLYNHLNRGRYKGEKQSKKEKQ